MSCSSWTSVARLQYHLVKDGHIIVRLANEGEKFTTLDDQERTMKTTDLMIADPEKGVAVAGVMGGANSEVMNRQVTS